MTAVAAPPHRSFSKALVHLVPRAGSEEIFEGRVREVAGELSAVASSAGLDVFTLFRLANDPLGRGARFRATLEILGEWNDAAESLTAGLGDRLSDVAHPELSTCLVGECLAFEESESAPVRYQYLMRANAHFDHRAYLARYRDEHAHFGLATPGKRGYAQLHVDLEVSQRAAANAGLGVWNFDSVSELHLESIETFLAAVADSPVPREAMADEAKFVDRKASVAFSSLQRLQRGRAYSGAVFDLLTYSTGG